MSFYEKGNVRIRYAGGRLRLSAAGHARRRPELAASAIWPNAVINAMEEFKNDFRCITMDQRNATGGESTGPVPVDDPWGAFADDQLGLMDHLGIRQFFFFGNCIGGSFALKLMERAPDRVVAAVLSQPVGHRPENPDVMYNSGPNVWAPEFRERRPDVSMETIEKYLHNLYRVRPDFVYSVSRDFARSCQTPMLVLPDDTPAHPLSDLRRHRVAGAERRGDGLSLEGPAGAEGPHHQSGAQLPEGTANGISDPSTTNADRPSHIVLALTRDPRDSLRFRASLCAGCVAFE